MARPVAIGPTSRTVIGDISPAQAPPSLASITADTKTVVKKISWKRYIVPAGLVGLAVFITYKHH